ncbi:MAG TPA: hypothetical protein PKZ70_04650 [Candidatus Atribacteria bacterium]|nr:hypothetical protein [Candidatus Atribacteria bacterium]
MGQFYSDFPGQLYAGGRFVPLFLGTMGSLSPPVPGGSLEKDGYKLGFIRR